MKQTKNFNISVPELGDIPDITQVSNAIRDLEDALAGTLEVLKASVDGTELKLVSEARSTSRTNYYEGMSVRFVAPSYISENTITSVSVDGLDPQEASIPYLVNSGDSVDITYTKGKFICTLQAVQRSSAIDLSSTNIVATSMAVKTLNDKKVDKTTQIIAGNGLAGGGSLSTNQTLTIVSEDEGILVREKIKLNVVDDLTTGGTKRPLSAEQGKVLKKLIDTMGTGGNLQKLMKEAELYSAEMYAGTLSSGGKAVTVGTTLFSPILYLNGIRIEESKFTVEKNAGLIILNEVYSPEDDVLWVVEDTYPYHIKFCFPTLNLLVADNVMKARIKMGDIIKILGESDPDDGEHRLVKCESSSKLNAVDIGGGRFLNEIPNTRQSGKLNDGGYKGTAKDIVDMIDNLNICPYDIGDILTTTLPSNPATRWTGTTWQKIEGRYLKGSSEAESSKTTGGSNTKTLSVANMPAHNHSATQADHNHTANHNHTASQSAHAHTQPSHYHGQGSTAESGSGSYFAVNAGHWKNPNPSSYWRTSSAGGENTGSAQPGVTVNTTNVTTSNATPAITVNNNGSGTAFDIQPAYYIVHYWLRTA